MSTAAAFLYETLADDLARLVAKGSLRPGDRLPSVRQLRDQRGVSAATVMQAYVLLETRGIVETRPQSGHYVRTPRSNPLPEPRPARVASQTARPTVSDLVARVYRAARDPAIVQLGSAIPSPALLPTDKLNRRMAAVAREAGGAGLAYDIPPGYAPLRRQIARRMGEAGVAIGADEIVTTFGTMEALSLALRAVAQTGDTIAVESPAYYGVLQLIESLGLRVLEIPVHASHGLDLECLEQSIRKHKVKACLAVTNFSNPSGSLMSDDAKRALVALCARHEVPLIEDDIYGDVHFGDVRPRPAKAFDETGNVMLCASFSKTMAPGYRVGWIAPGRWRDRVERLKFAQSIATATLPQMAIADFLAHGGYERHVRRMRKMLVAQAAQISDAIAASFPPGTRVSRPQGGYVLWVELPPGKSGLDLHTRALERGINVAPGPIFSAFARFTNFVRMGYGAPWSEVIERGVRTLGAIASSL